MSLLTQVLEKALTGLIKGAGRIIHRFFRGTSIIIDKVFEAFAWPFVGTFLLLLISTTIAEGSQKLREPLSKLLAAQTGGKINADQLGGVQGFEFFTGMAQGVGAFFFESMLDVFTPEGGITPESGRINAQKFVGVNMLININSWAIKMFADILGLGKFESIGALPLQMSWAMGLGWLTWVIMGPPLQMLIADPLVQGLNAKYLPNKLSLAQVLDFYTEGLKDEAWFKAQMQFQGYDEDTAFLVWEGRRKKFTRTQAKRFYERGVIKEKQLRDFIKREGWTDDELDLLVDEIKNERTFDLTEDIAKEALSLFQNGQLDESKTTAYLRESNWSSSEVSLAIELGELRKLRTDLSPSQILNLMGDALLSESQAFQRLTNKGYDASDAQMLIQQEILSRKEKPKPQPVPKEVTLTQAQVLMAYRQGVISEAEARERLQDLGLDSADISILIELNTPLSS